jgi:hypothetical protein
VHVQPIDINQQVEIVVTAQLPELTDLDAGNFADCTSTVETPLNKLVEPATDRTSEKPMIDLLSGTTVQVPVMQRGQLLATKSFADWTDYLQDQIGDRPKNYPDIITRIATYGYSDILLRALTAHDSGANSTALRNAIYSDNVTQRWHYIAPLVIAPPAPVETCLDVPDLISESNNDDVSAGSPPSAPKTPPYFFEADDRARKKQAFFSIGADHYPPGPPFLIAVYYDDIIVHAPPFHPGKMRIIAHGDQRLQDYDLARALVVNRERMAFLTASYVRGELRAANSRKRLRVAVASGPTERDLRAAERQRVRAVMESGATATSRSGSRNNRDHHRAMAATMVPNDDASDAGDDDPFPSYTNEEYHDHSEHPAHRAYVAYMFPRQWTQVQPRTVY